MAPKTPEAKARQLAGLNRGSKKGKRSGRAVDLGVFCLTLLRNHSRVDPTVKQLNMSKQTAYRYLRLPECEAAMATAREALLQETAKESAKKIVREVTLDRNDIIMGLADIAQKGESERARVAAWLGLADIYMLRAKNVRDVNEFYGWTADELERYAVTGEVPERFRSTFSEIESPETSLRTEKI